MSKNHEPEILPRRDNMSVENQLEEKYTLAHLPQRDNMPVEDQLKKLHVSTSAPAGNMSIENQLKNYTFAHLPQRGNMLVEITN